jgi:hypothetical protein
MRMLFAIALLLGLLSFTFTTAHAEWESLDVGSTTTADQTTAASK